MATAPKWSNSIPLPSASDVEFYEQHGWWVSDRIFSDVELEVIKKAVHRHQHGHRDVALPIRLSADLDWSPESGDRVRANDYVAYQSRDIRRVALKSVIGAMAAKLAHTGLVRLFNSSFVEKPPQKTGEPFRVSWHTDKAFWGTCTSSSMLTAWIPTEDANQANGTIEFLDGSHRWPQTDGVRRLQTERHFIGSDDKDLVGRASDLGLSVAVVPANVPRGHVSFHHCMLFHGSGPNTTNRNRGALILHLQDEANGYQTAYDENSKPVVLHNDRLVHRDASGKPDYCDPDFCPVLWNE